MPERWLPIPGFTYYEVSDQGRVRSLPRVVQFHNGRTRYYPGQILTPIPHSKTEHLKVNLYSSEDHDSGRAFFVHTLVLLAFVGPRLPGQETCHEDDVPTHNALDNLRWGSRSQNKHDEVRNGRHYNARKTHCIRGHEFNAENTCFDHKGSRRCRTCRRAAKNRCMARKRTGIMSR